MKQIAAQQYHVDLTLVRKPKDLLKGLEGILAADWILLQIAKVVVGRHQYRDSVLFVHVHDWHCVYAHATANSSADAVLVE